MWTVLQTIVTAWIERGRDGYAITALILFLCFVLACAYLTLQAGRGAATAIGAVARLLGA